MDDRPTMRIVSDPADADPDAICLTLFQEQDRLMGWFIGPVTVARIGVSMPYLPRSDRCAVGMALATAMTAALVAGRDICILDPEGLWALV